MKYGIILCSFGYSENEFKQLIQPLLRLKNEDVNNTYKLVVVSVKFEGFDVSGITNPPNEFFLENGADYVFQDTSEKIYKEYEARNSGFKMLTENFSPDYICLWDGDEYPSYQDLKSLFILVPTVDVAWYKLSYKNYVFDKNTYIDEPFCPPRIFKMSYYNYRFIGFYFDNDANYEKNGEVVNYKNLSSIVIPTNIAHINHYSWLNDERSRRKVEYQNKHFGTGHCSFEWDSEKGLIFSVDFHKKMGIPLPATRKIS